MNYGSNFLNIKTPFSQAIAKVGTAYLKNYVFLWIMGKSTQ
jgi:hypothetical protein